MSAAVPEIDDWKSRKALEVKQLLEKLLFGVPISPSPVSEWELTNKKRRNLKKMFNELVNLTDRMFQGFHTDGSPIGSLSDDEKEIEMLFQVLKKTPTLSFAKAERTIKKWIVERSRDIETVYSSKKHELIALAYEKYKAEASKKNVTVKTRGLDFVSKCWEYSQSEIVDPVLEEQINNACDDLETLVLDSFDDSFTFETFANSLIPVLDISGSMKGTPIQTGLFYLLMLVKVFDVSEVHFFESHHTVRAIDVSWETNLDLIKQIYTNVRGSTDLSSVFKYLNDVRTSNKNVVIITDGDCDPNRYYGGSSNPFHEVTRVDKEASAYPKVVNCNFIVVNVKETELKFPYLNIDPRVCYLTGNNPKTLNGFIKALCEATKTGTPITPDLILKYTLALDELALETPVPKYSSIMSDERITELFEVFQKNLPPKKPTEVTAAVGGAGDSDIESW